VLCRQAKSDPTATNGIPLWVIAANDPAVIPAAVNPTRNNTKNPINIQIGPIIRDTVMAPTHDPTQLQLTSSTSSTSIGLER